MQLPRESSGYQVKVRYGRYVVGALRRAKMNALAADAEAATTALKAAGRAQEDAKEPVQTALAERDGADADLDNAAQNARANLAGRSKNAAKEEPYASVFPEGIGYYTAAPVDEEEARYQTLVRRVESALAADDVVRTTLPPLVAAGIASYKTAVLALSAAEGLADTADLAARRADSAWRRQLERIYGALVSELGKARAESFFPRIHEKSAHEPQE